jgi:uncharacterized spore protein YtfJ
METQNQAIDRGQQNGREIIERIFSATRPGAAYGEPTHVGERLVITASEISAGGGYGFGSGTSAPTEPAAGPAAGSGGGAGGGGGSTARPVAVISVGPDGVTVRPIVDVTKVVLALVTAWGAMALTLVRMNRARRG